MRLEDEVSKDDTEAVKWYRKAAEQGNDRAKGSLTRLGVGFEFVLPAVVYSWMVIKDIQGVCKVIKAKEKTSRQ